MSEPLRIDADLVRRLVATQFPQWAHLPVRAVEPGGWDNRTFRLGDQLTARLPSARHYVAQVEKEQHWLPTLAGRLPFPITEPVARGEPGEGYPFPWSVCRWLDGQTLLAAPVADLVGLARDLANFLSAFQALDAADGPVAGLHSFHRGGALANYDAQTRQAVGVLGDAIDGPACLQLWDAALKSAWRPSPVWVHGDVAAGNLLVRDGHLAAVIDFGQLAVGDPACDLAIAWTLFSGESRAAFRSGLQLDDDTWTRGRAWTLWKAVIVLAGLSGVNPDQRERYWCDLSEVLSEPL